MWKRRKQREEESERKASSLYFGKDKDERKRETGVRLIRPFVLVIFMSTGYKKERQREREGKTQLKLKLL